MTSKESLELLKCSRHYNIITGEVKKLKDTVFIKCVEKLEKELEVLEILKPMLEIKKGNTWEYLETKHCFFDTQEQIDLIKEWLEDDN